MIQAVPTSAGFKFEVPDPRRYQKDRVQAIALANYMLTEKIKVPVFDVDSLATGFWIT